MIAIARAALETMHAHCAQAYPLECCGALVGEPPAAQPQVRRIVDAWPLQNDAVAPRRRFEVSPEEYRALERRADQGGRTLLGFYHSHPDGAARPSATDLSNAWPNFDYIIVSVMAGTPAATSGWRLAVDRQSMVGEELTCLSES
jgi:proteasome lid subunit RPN8/RPN11